MQVDDPFVSDVCGIALLGAVLSFAAVRWIKADQVRGELHDLALAEHLDAYLYGRDLELMRELESERQWNAMRSRGGLNADTEE